MPTPTSLAVYFVLTALRANGTGVAGAQIKIRNASGTDITSTLFGATSPVTDAGGHFSFTVRPFEGLTPGVAYVIQVLKPGFALWSVTTPTSFIGGGTYTANLTRLAISGDGYILTLPTNGFASALYPIPTSVESPTTDLDWEIIAFHITHLDARTSVLEAPVDPVTKLALADIHSRVRLHPRPNLVPDGAVALVDPDFSDRLTVTTDSLSDEGSVSIPGGFVFSAANMVPPGNVNDLSAYTNGGSDGLIRWITLLTEPVVFRGFYADAMIWLIDEEAEYVLHTNYYNNAGTLLNGVEEALTANWQVQRIRLDPVPDGAVRAARLWVTAGEVIVTRTLTLHYRG